MAKEEDKKINIMIDELIKRAKIASEEYKKLSQEDVDRIIKKMSMAVLENHMNLAKMAVEETGRGIYEDKITKNIFASEYVYHSIKYDKTVGVVQDNQEKDIKLLLSLLVLLLVLHQLPIPLQQLVLNH